MLIYLGVSALLVFGCALWLLLSGDVGVLAGAHLLLAGGVLPLIFGAIAHFIPVLTRSGAAPRVVELAPLALQLAGALAFVYFSGGAGGAAVHAAAVIALAVCVAFAAWLASRAKRCLGRPHPGWRWYLAAIVMLALGLALVPLLAWRPELRPALRLLHLHLNLLGFVGLTAIGTLQVLLPTVLSGPDAEASARLRSDLPWAVGGVLAVAFGAAFYWPLAPIGALLLAGVTCRLGWAWWRRYGLRALVGDGASAALVGALCGFLSQLILGVAHGFGMLSGHDAVLAFFVAFLLPLVSGALTQLLPVWRYPGRSTPARVRLREALVYGGAMRAALFLTGGALLAVGVSAGLWFAAAALLFFVLALLRSFI